MVSGGELTRVSCKILNFLNLAVKYLNFPNLGGKIWKIQNPASKIWKIHDLATHHSLTRGSNSRRITHQVAGPRVYTEIQYLLPAIQCNNKKLNRGQLL